MHYLEAGFQATNLSGTYTGYVTFVRALPLHQPDSSLPWGYLVLGVCFTIQEEGEAVSHPLFIRLHPPSYMSWWL